MDRRSRLEQLAAAARPLELDAAARAQETEAVRRYVEDWLQALPEKPVYMPDQAAATADALRIAETGSAIDDALRILAEQVDNSGQNLGSSRFFAYIPSGGLYPAALGDYLAAAINRYAGVDYAAPGAARLENSLLAWLAREIGYPETARGDLASGGSIATLSAIVAAREQQQIGPAEIERSCVYLTGLTHHCVRKALQIAGLAACRLREVPLDAQYRMDLQALRKLLAADRAAGLRPWLLVGSAGTTDLGSIDPLPALAEIAEEQRLWLHVDAAYGGAFILCSPGRQRLAGMERADSLVINPHKGLFLPTGLGILLVRDGSALYAAFHERGSYMQDAGSPGTPQAISACDFSPELTRPFRGLRLWLPLKLFGLAPFRAALEEKLLLAEHFHEQLSATPGFETGPAPDLSIVAFRYRPARGDSDAFNRRLFAAIRDDGRIFLSTTQLDGRFTLRLAILGYHTHLADVELALAVIREQAARLQDS